VKRGDPDERAAWAHDADASSDADADPRVASFLRGVTIGALVGAAIAGAALWERAARRRAAEAATTGDDDTPPS
jgi:hypothetical protein